jgi:parvulin-like peptidyl-prolyl isomerase
MSRSPLAVVALLAAPALALAAGTAPAPAPASAPPAPAAPAAAPAGAAAAKPSGTAEGAYATFKVPLFSEGFASFPVAEVGDERILLSELNEALAEAHEDRMSGKDKAGKSDFAPILDRLITVRLIVSEAREMGIQDLPEVKQALEGFGKDTARGLVKDRATASAKPDGLETEQIYKSLIHEVKVRSAAYDKEADVWAASAAIVGGKSYDEVVSKDVADKRAKGGQATEFVRIDRMLPEVIAIVGKLKPGQTALPFKLNQAWVLIVLEDERYPDDPAAREQAEAKSLERVKANMLRAYGETLTKKYVTVDRKVLASLDLEVSPAAFQKALKDKRPVARIKGAAPITVGELVGQIQQQFFHGLDKPVEEKKVNKHKGPTLDAMLSRRLLEREAKNLGIEKTPEYQKAVRENEASTLFGVYLQKVILPEVKLKDADLQAYYEAHRTELTYPAFYKLQSVTFTTSKEAQAAVAKLKAGTDFGWLRANAEGLVKEDDRKVQLDGATLAASALPADLASALAGASRGDVRTWSAEGQYYVVQVAEVTPPAVRPFDDARPEIAKKVFGEKLQAAIADIGAKLRATREVKVYITRVGG